jgi:hypothetical protein
VSDPQPYLGDVRACAKRMDVGTRTVYKVIATDPTFPPARELWPGGPRKRVLDEVDEWSRNRPRIQRGAQPPQFATEEVAAKRATTNAAKSAKPIKRKTTKG